MNVSPPEENAILVFFVMRTEPGGVLREDAPTLLHGELHVGELPVQPSPGGAARHPTRSLFWEVKAVTDSAHRVVPIRREPTLKDVVDCYMKILAVRSPFHRVATSCQLKAWLGYFGDVKAKEVISCSPPGCSHPSDMG